MGLSSDLLYPEHRRAEFGTLRRRALAGEVVERYETECQRKDGLIVQILLTLCPIRSREGAVVGTWVTARDATEQKLAQTTLAESDARLEEAQALAHVGTWLWDTSSDTVQLSLELHQICGINPLEFDGTFDSYFDLVHPDEREMVEAALRRALDAGHSFEREYRMSAGGRGAVGVRPGRDRQRLDGQPTRRPPSMRRCRPLWKRSAATPAGR